MPYSIIKGDITKYKADAIVIPANMKPVVGTGVDYQIFEKAGFDELMSARKSIGDIPIGEARATEAFNLDAKCIIHAVSPLWNGGNNDEEILLKNCYLNVLECAVKNECKTVAFPLLSAGALKFPLDIAQEVAEDAFEEFEKKHPEIEIFLLVYRKKKQVSQADIEKINKLLEEEYYGDLTEEEYKQAEREWGNLPKEREEYLYLQIYRKKMASKKKDELEEKVKSIPKAKKLKKNDFSFSYSIMLPESLKEEIGNKGMSFNDLLYTYLSKYDKMSDIYNPAHMDRRLFSKILDEKSGLTVQKKHIIQLAVGLKLSFEQLQELLDTKGYKISGSLKSDIIVKHYFTEKKYDVDEINAALEHYGEKAIC